LLLILMPIAVSIAVIYTYNKLTAESELIVLNAVGISKWQLARPAVILGLACVLLCYALSLYLMPEANRRFRDIRSLFRDKYASVLLEEEVFNSPMEGLTVFVRERDRNNNLGGILLHDSRNPKETVTMIAESGRVEQTESGPKFYLERGMRQQMKDGRVSWLAFDNYAIEIAFYGKAVTRSYSPQEQTIVGLYQRNDLNEKQQRAYRAEANQRLTWPLFAVVLPLFALATLFSSEFNRRGQSRRMVGAAIGITVIIVLYFTLRNATVRYGMLSPMLYVLVIGVGMASSYILLSGRVIRFTQMFASPMRMPRAGEA
jgi:lipopolysaccharide export system permease protein